MKRKAYPYGSIVHAYDSNRERRGCCVTGTSRYLWEELPNRCVSSNLVQFPTWVYAQDSDACLWDLVWRMNPRKYGGTFGLDGRIWVGCSDDCIRLLLHPDGHSWTSSRWPLSNPWHVSISCNYSSAGGLLQVARQPYCRSKTIPKLPTNLISRVENLAYPHRIVSVTNRTIIDQFFLDLLLCRENFIIGSVEKKWFPIWLWSGSGRLRYSGSHISRQINKYNLSPGISPCFLGSHLQRWDASCRMRLFCCDSRKRVTHSGAATKQALVLGPRNSSHQTSATSHQPHRLIASFQSWIIYVAAFSSNSPTQVDKFLCFSIQGASLGERVTRAQISDPTSLLHLVRPPSLSIFSLSSHNAFVSSHHDCIHGHRSTTAWI